MKQDGFGYIDAKDVERVVPKWIIDGLLPEGFGFLAGSPKAKNSPHGGKTVLSREMARSVTANSTCLGKTSFSQGTILMVNLDEPAYRIKERLEYLSGGQLREGIKISKTSSLQLPEGLARLRADIVELKPVLVIIDPLLRTTNGKDLNNISTTGPILDALKKIHLELGVTILVIHHSVKNPERDKESTASWLSGSTDLDSAWDFCLCLEYDHKTRQMHLRCFYRYYERKDIYYIAEKNAENNITALKVVTEEDGDFKNKSIIASLSGGDKTVEEILAETNIPSTTIKNKLKELGAVERCKKGKAKVWGLVSPTDQTYVGQKEGVIDQLIEPG